MPKIFCDSCPHWKTCYSFHCFRKQTFNENYKWFSGLYFRVGEAWTTHRLGVYTYRSTWKVLCLIGVYSPQDEKQTIGNALEKGLEKTEWMELAKGKWVFPEAVRCWGGWNELNAMEWRVDGGEVRTASPETKWEKRMNLPQAHGNKTRSIFWYCNN